MRKVADGLYVHRKEWIIRDDQGICIEWAIHPLDIYKTLEDAKQAINKYMDGSNTKEPIVIGQWISPPRG